MIPIPLAASRKPWYPPRVSERRAVVFAVVLTAVFVVVRAHVYYDWPVLNAADWNRRDAFMTWPRLAAGAACLAAMAAWGGLRRWGVRRNATAAGLALLAAAGAGIVSANLGFGPGAATGAQVAQALWTTVPVALWEEACYRGLLYRGLRADLSPLAAASGSSTFFMLMHYQAQATYFWPWIFAYGLAACAAAESGTGLPWLVFAHWTCDVLVAALARAPDASAVAFSQCYMGAVFLAAAYLLWAKRPRTKAGLGPRTRGNDGPSGAML